jgi:hypothetical protein
LVDIKFYEVSCKVSAITGFELGKEKQSVNVKELNDGDLQFNCQWAIVFLGSSLQAAGRFDATIRSWR